MANKTPFKYSILITLTISLLVTNSLSVDKHFLVEKNVKEIFLPVKNFLLLTTFKTDLKINGFRAESSRYPISIDENGLTVIPDQQVINLRIFGHNLISENEKSIKIGFTTTDGQTGDKCDPDNVFTAKDIINNNMALVEINLSETITDKPYYVCYGVGKNYLNRYTTDGKKQLSLNRLMHFYYLSSHESMRIRVIGRQLAMSDKSSKRDANIKMKLAQIIDEANKIHRIADEMQEW